MRERSRFWEQFKSMTRLLRVKKKLEHYPGLSLEEWK